MEDKPRSFYEILSANVKQKPQKQQEKKPAAPFYRMMAWVVIFIANSWILQLCWNYGLVNLLEIPPITFIQSIMVYTLSKVLTRGMFSVQ